jgi:hypothetical protein
MTDFMPEPEFVEVSDRIWGALGKYLPHKDGKTHVGFTRHGSINPQIAKEQIYDAMKRAKKASGKRHLDPLMKRGFPNRMVNMGVSDMLGNTTLKKGSKGTRYIVKNYFASKLGWARKKVVGRLELPKLRGKLRRRRRIKR